ncbi:MAG: preprotein translocase subunit SecG [Lachnospiraceae bacterium]
MKTGLTIAFVFVCFFIIVLVLIQEAKDNGLGSLAGTGSTDTYWSKNKGRDKEGWKILATTILVAVFLILSLLIGSKFIN